MKFASCAAALLCLLAGAPATALSNLTYAGNGITLFDMPVPNLGVMYGVAPNGELLWYRYDGAGQHDRSAATGWHASSGNAIDNGWQHFDRVLGAGNGVILAIEPDGDLLWYQYIGHGQADPTGSTGWHANSGNVIGNGWGNFRHIAVSPLEGPLGSHRLTIYAVAQNGDLLWYSYEGNGEEDPSGSTGWHPNSGNQIGNGWAGFDRLVGAGDIILGVQSNGDLLWYRYNGNGERDPGGTKNWSANSGNPIGNGWHNFRDVFGGTRGSGNVIYAVASDGDLLWYQYNGNGERDLSGSTGWSPNSGNPIGNGW